MRSSTVTFSVVLMWCTSYKPIPAKRLYPSNMQISNENSAQRTEFVRAAWSAASYSKLNIYSKFSLLSRYHHLFSLSTTYPKDLITKKDVITTVILFRNTEMHFCLKAIYFYSYSNYIIELNEYTQ